jgi:rhamnogalacturonyl hydrolase YesR
MLSRKHWPSYTTDLVLEGILALYDATGEARHLDFVLGVWEFRGRPRDSLTIGNSYFTCLHAETFRRTGDPRFVEGLVEVADEWRRTAPRTPEGAVAHRKVPSAAVLLDMLAGYAPLMAAAGALSGDESFLDECVRQCRLYRDILRDPATGLWHHARGWSEADRLSPAGWCRGQGWAMRTLVKSLAWMPPLVVPPSGGSGGCGSAEKAPHECGTTSGDAGSVVCSSAFRRLPGEEKALALLEMLRELTDSLLHHQQPSGMWNQLVDEPDSYPETSGTGFIVSTLHAASRSGWIDAAPAAIRGAKAMSAYVAFDGTVRSGCPGTSPMATREDYRKHAPQTDDPHAVAAVLMALA